MEAVKIIEQSEMVKILFGGYELDAETDAKEGGVGAVYLCHDTFENVECAIKALLSKKASADNLERFYADMEGWIDLDLHENIICVISIAHVYDYPYVVMERIADTDGYVCSLN